MTPIAEMIRQMTDAGVGLDTILLAVEAVEKAVENTVSTRHRVDVSAEKRRAWDREYRRNKREIHPNPPDIHPTSENASISKNIKKESKRGTRIASDWTPSDSELAFAKAEGFSDWEIQREAQKFRDYWTACAGAKGVKLDWAATWRQWVRNGADRSGKTPAPSEVAASVSGFYAAADSEQLAAWDSYGLRTTGKGMPRDKNQGWRVKSEWPPDYQQPAQEAAE